jgi:hypothetical protein
VIESYAVSRAARWVVPVVAAVLLFGLAFVVTLSGGSAVLAPSSTAPAAAGCAVTVGTLHLNPEQAANAQTIVDVGARMGIPPQGRVVALATALQESTLVNVNHGDAAGPDSRGLFQQRASWGSEAQRMDPATSAALFYRALLAVPGWEALPVTVAAQRVQSSARPDAYAKWEAQARAIVGAPQQPCQAPSVVAGQAVAFSGSSTGCTVPDPSGTGGCVTPALAYLLRQVSATFPHRPVSCWDAHAWNPTSDHPKGKACDFTFGTLGVMPGPTDTAAGWQLAKWLRVNAGPLHVAYVIWQGHIWSRSQDAAGWRAYTGGGVYNPAQPTGGHYDHVHVSTVN